MLGPEAVVEQEQQQQQQQPTSSVASGLVCESCLVSGVEPYACIHTYTRTRLFFKSKYNHSTHSALMTHHQDNFTPIALFPSRRFTKHTVVPPAYTCARTHFFFFFSIPPSCPLWLPYSESHAAFFPPFFFLHRITLKKPMPGLIDVNGNEEVASSKETPYGWEQHTDERHLQKALVHSWHA